MTENTNIQAAFVKVLAESSEIPPKQKQVLAASLALFAEQGFSQTTTKQIAERAGVAEGTVYKRYQSKDELLAALLKPLITDVLPRLMQEFARQVVTYDHLTRRQFITTLIDNRTHFLEANWQETKILINEMLTNETVRQHLVVKAVPVLQANLYPVLDKLKAAGELTDWPDDQLAQFMIGTVLTNLVRANFEGSLAQFEARVPTLIDFLDRGLTPQG